MDKYIVDRIENDKIVCEKYETKEMIDIDKSLINDDIKEGDIIVPCNNQYKVLKDETKKRRKYIQSLFDDLKKSVKKSKIN